MERERERRTEREKEREKERQRDRVTVRTRARARERERRERDESHLASVLWAGDCVAWLEQAPKWSKFLVVAERGSCFFGVRQA